MKKLFIMFAILLIATACDDTLIMDNHSIVKQIARSKNGNFDIITIKNEYCWETEVYVTPHLYKTGDTIKFCK